MRTEKKAKSEFRYNRTNAIIEFIAFSILALNVGNSDLQLTFNIVGGTIFAISIIIACIRYKKPNKAKLSKVETNCM